MAHSVSPLAPRAVPHLPAIDGVELAIAETGIRYKNRPDVLLATLAPGTTVAGCFTLSKSRSAPVDWCAQSLKGGSGAGGGDQCGQCQCLYGQGGGCDGGRGCQGSGATPEVQASGNFSGLNRGHRRAAEPGSDCRRIAGIVCGGQGGVLGRCGARHHDHGYVCQGGNGDREVRGQDRHHQRHRQGLRA